ncbi:sulfite exporter TauE/SafE family protein [Leptospira bandrabouensis]|uniref:sulfite exporter TauE/SafE family protein n=1 Tax=Leptospira bandrabouensis TaxID=2484903 RepID=UPI00223DBFF6|nr:sulfite exporter TauE/SafE family protein [Leptospira bandrabouensis]MCW7457942.1 sulfite exporter TauE/SafE family protein [Leptospira bandrabouensis]MCW7479071.1 sulfite exporter TauE/SafE family protein [Leptospira bandrabouensis]MCW7486801.1 sulfite exporter TauE/SafE family protein [Leptospira bandrabouensis]
MDQLANLSFFGSIFLYGFVSSFHCVVMCGPFVSLLQTEKGKQIPIYLYHLGRLISYSFLGMVLGFLGKGANALGDLTAVRGVAGVLTFLFLIVFTIRTYSTKSTSSFGYLPQGIRKFIETIRSRFSKNGLGFGIGMVSALLPCGVLYPAYAASFATGSLLNGGFVMLFFYMGTVPALTGLGWIVGKWRHKIPTKWIPAFGTIVILTSLGFLLYRLFFHSHGESCDHLL